ncbi:hypothetical protein ISG33_14345 [Glaciecola sp. MH2013]|uniref:hypothetical protein n=1 Tax=Glaciecola sp. MH2013 TaxID=2785524 RepID=UPI00189D1D15|nr:hypothetical protein [Glaciecola sp. MH2013]MBF7074582.1 hypothetical protein [Glaciecola sp. MH2013]
MILVFLLMCLSLNVFATTCEMDFNNPNEHNDRYGSIIHVSVTKISDFYEVSVKFPKEIESTELSFVVLQLMDGDAMLFGSQLDVTEFEYMSSVYFTLQNSLAVDAYLTSYYGTDCQSLIWKKVVFNEER